MPIQDLANNFLVTSTSPMIGFVDAQLTKSRELSLLIYRFLIEGIREADQVDGNQFVERFLQGPQQVWQGIDRSIRSLPDMWSVTSCPDRFLPYLKWIVGWTSELDYVTDELDAAALRRLIATSIPFWKVRGTEDALLEITQLTTAARMRILDWFDLRYIAGETGLSEAHDGHDPWVLLLPGPPDYPEKQINVRIVDDGTLNRRLVRNLAKLTRPAGERITITYLGFLDLFTTDDDSSQWTPTIGPTAAPVGSLLSPAVNHGAMVIDQTTIVHANPVAADNWRNYVVSVTFQGFGIAFSTYRTGDDDLYVILYAEGQIQIVALVAGALVPVASATTFDPTPPFGPDIWVSLDVDQVNTLRVLMMGEGGQTRITVWLNGVFVLTVLDSNHTRGSIGFIGAFLPGFTTLIREVEMYFVPIEEDVINIQGAS